MANQFCDEDCNHCPVMLHPNSKMVTFILNAIYEKFGDEAYRIVQNACPNLTVCYNCRIDDFCHIEGCKLASEAEKHARNEKVEGTSNA